MVLMKKRPFFYLFFMQYKARKNKSLKSRKFDIFPEGLTHRFARKMAIFPTFFCKEI